MTLRTRDELFHQNQERLEQIAYVAMEKIPQLSDFVVLLIDLEDATWADLVKILNPSQAKNLSSRPLLQPVFRTVVKTKVVLEYLIQAVPEIEPAMTGELPAGNVRAVVLGDEGASVYFIVPKPNPTHN